MILKIAILSLENCFLFVTFFNPYLIIGIGKIQLSKSVMQWSYESHIIRPCVNGHMILILSYFLLSTKPLQAPYRCHLHLFCTDSDTTYSCTNSDITSYTSTLVFSRKKVLRILQSRGQATCLIAGSQKIITYRSTPFWIW